MNNQANQIFKDYKQVTWKFKLLIEWVPTIKMWVRSNDEKAESFPHLVTIFQPNILKSTNDAILIQLSEITMELVSAI